MAHGFLNPTDLRTERNFLGNIASAIGDRVGRSSNMARKERAFASKKAEDGGTSLEEAGIGKGYFFKRALGSSFGGDKIARTRGRFESDPGPGRDPTGTQASRFRGGFDYDVTNEIFGSAGDVGGALSALSGGGLAAGGAGGVAQKLLEAGPQAINPEVLGGEIAKYQGTKTNAAGFAVDTTATEIGDIAGILNQIGQIIVRSNNTTVQAIDSVQRINVKVVDSVQNLGQLQIGIAERQLQQQMLLASNAENTQEQIAARQLAASEKANMARQKSSSGSLDPEGSGFEGPQGGILGSMFGGMGNLLDAGLSMLGGGRRGRRRGLGRMSRAGRRAQRAQGFSTAIDGSPGVRGMNFRDTTSTGSTLSRSRIRAGTAGKDVYKTAQNDITQRYAQRYGQKAAIKRFGSEGLEAAGMTLTKGARVMKFLSPVLKRVPVVGGLLDFGISLALGEPVGRAAAKAIGATFGAGLGSFIPIPGVGTILGGIAGDLVGGAIYDALIGGAGGGKSSSMPSGADGMVTTGPKSGYLAQLHGTEVTLSGNKSKEMRAISLNIGEGILEAQKNNKRKYAELQAAGFSAYFDKKPWWQGLLDALGKLLPKWLKGGGDDDDGDPDRRPGSTAGSETLDIGSGGGKLKGLSREDYVQMAKTIAGEAGPGDDRYLVAGAVLNRVASKEFPNSVKSVVTAGQGTAHPQFEGYLPNANVDAEVKKLMSPEGQAKLVEALERLEGRTDFKGQTMIGNRVAAEDPMFDKKGNYAHYSWQKGPNSVMPSNYVVPNFEQFIEKENNAAPQTAPPPILELFPVEPSEDKPEDLFRKSLLIQQQEKKLQQNPFVFTLPPQPQQQSSSQESQSTASLMTGGSNALGLISFANINNLK